MCVILFSIIFLLGNCSAYIFQLNGSQYLRMPPIFHLDPYDACVHEDDDSGVYCSVKFDLVTDQPSDLYTMIIDYSNKTEIHFNHTQLSYGICLSKTCKEFNQNNKIRDQGQILEACLNETMWKKYKLKTRVQEKYICEKLEHEYILYISDILVAVILGILVLLNLVGSLQEFFLRNKGSFKQGNKFLSCFSISRNWRKLVAPGGEGSDPRFRRLTGLYGMKAISIMCVIMFHSMLPFVMNSQNTHDFEKGYNNWYYQIVANGTLVVQTFFIMSGFMLSYNTQIYAERHKITWISAPHTIFLRWMRLSPPYFLVLAVTATWLRYFGSGPLWQSVVLTEVEDCRHDWWLHLIYMNNYIDFSNCLIQSWYIAADFQLFCIGVLVCMLTAGRGRKIVLALLFVAGVLMPAIHTYIQDLDGNLLITPELARNLFIENPTFNNTYKRGHTNVPTFIIGLALGLLVYHWQSTGYKFHCTIRHRLLFWLTVPAGISVIYIASLFYRDAPRDSVYVRTVYAAFVKPVWGIVFGYFIFGMVFRFEDTYRRILEWRGWAVPSRVSYCAYLLHMTLIRLLTGTRTTTVHFSILHLLETLTSSITISFLAAVPFHLLFEAPFLQMVKLCSSGKSNHNETKDIVEPIDTRTEDDENSNKFTHEDENNKGVLKDITMNGIHAKAEERTNGVYITKTE